MVPDSCQTCDHGAAIRKMLEQLEQLQEENLNLKEQLEARLAAELPEEHSV